MPRPIFENPHLDGSTFFLSGEGTVNVLMLHGFTATTVEVRPLSEHLHSLGYTVLAPLLPGHGTRPEDLIGIRWQDWYRVAEDGYQSLAGNGKKTFVAGESMGGLLSLLLAANHAEISGVILFAPALIIRGIGRAKWIAPFKKTMPKNYLKDENDAAKDTLPWQGYNILTLSAVAQLERLQKAAAARLDRIHQPALIFQGKLDGTVDEAGATQIYQQIRTSDKALVWLENSGHCIVLDRELDEVKTQVSRFIQRLF